ncbi:MAG: biotin transporter BioY [Firmicutes bacterium]|nr:biotin transporter BioY [Bacillota bacterium]
MDVEAVHDLRSYAGKVRHWFEELSFAGKVGIAACFSAFIGLAAQIRIPLPWTPVPITGQTFAVLVTGALLGGGWSGFAAGLYVAAGAVGLPWFAGWNGGWTSLAGPTGGYLLGFVPAAMIVGYAVWRFPWTRSMAGLLGVMTAANFFLIHGPGLLVLSFFTGVHDPVKLLWMGTIPFIPGDLTKIAAAAMMAWPLLPRGTGEAGR